MAPTVPPLLFLQSAAAKNAHWKGDTYTQIGPVNAFNRPIDQQSPLGARVFAPMPIKHYRRELPGTSTVPSGCTDTGAPLPGLYHSSVHRMRDHDRPGGLVTQSMVTSLHQDTVAPLIPVSDQFVGVVQSCSSSEGVRGEPPIEFSDQANARRRARGSGGGIRKIPARLDSGPLQPQYFSSTHQRLYARNRTFEQNQITQLRQGDATITPGQAGSYDHVYASGTATSCPGQVGGPTTYVPVYYKPSNNKYATQGAVSASQHILRKHYDAVTYGGQVTQTPAGLLKPSALAYIIGGDAYRLKDKIGSAAPLVPTVTATGEYRTCASSRMM